MCVFGCQRQRMLNARGIPATQGQENNLLQLRSGKANGPQRAGNMCRFALQYAPSCNAKRHFLTGQTASMAISCGSVEYGSLAPLRNIITKTGLRHPCPYATTAGNLPAGQRATVHQSQNRSRPFGCLAFLLYLCIRQAAPGDVQANLHHARLHYLGIARESAYQA